MTSDSHRITIELTVLRDAANRDRVAEIGRLIRRIVESGELGTDLPATIASWRAVAVVSVVVQKGQPEHDMYVRRALLDIEA